MNFVILVLYIFSCVDPDWNKKGFNSLFVMFKHYSITLQKISCVK